MKKYTDNETQACNVVFSLVSGEVQLMIDNEKTNLININNGDTYNNSRHCHYRIANCRPTKNMGTDRLNIAVLSTSSE